MRITPDKRFYRPDEIGQLLGVSVRTIQRWAREGKLGYVHTPGQGIRIPATAIEKFLEEAKFCRG